MSWRDDVRDGPAELEIVGAVAGSAINVEKTNDNAVREARLTERARDCRDTIYRIHVNFVTFSC